MINVFEIREQLMAINIKNYIKVTDVIDEQLGFFQNGDSSMTVYYFENIWKKIDKPRLINFKEIFNMTIIQIHKSNGQIFDKYIYHQLLFSDYNIWNNIIEIFIDFEFEGNLNKNKHLIGFTNGVFDLSKNQFRKLEVTDNISLTVGYDYQEFNEEDDDVTKIEKYFRELFPVNHVMRYVFKLITDYLCGCGDKNQINDGCKDDDYMIWSGQNNNLIDLIALTFGEYCSVLSDDHLYHENEENILTGISPLDIIHKRLIIFKSDNVGCNINFNCLRASLYNYCYITPKYLDEDEDVVSYSPTHKILLSSNQIPHICLSNINIWRKLTVVELNENAYIDDIDNMKKSLIWYIINKCYPLYKKYGVDKIEKVNGYKYYMKYHIFSIFINNNMVKTFSSHDKIHLNEIMNRFKIWYVKKVDDTCLYLLNDLRDYLTNYGYNVIDNYLSSYIFLDDIE